MNEITEQRLHSRPNVSTLRSSVFIRGGLMLNTTNNRYGQRLCLEAWHINASPCALNRDDGSHLPQEYLHLVGR